MENMTHQVVRRYIAEHDLLIREEWLNLSMEISNDGKFDWNLSRK
jgi:hypothetical protein